MTPNKDSKRIHVHVSAELHAAIRDKMKALSKPGRRVCYPDLMEIFPLIPDKVLLPLVEELNVRKREEYKTLKRKLDRLSPEKRATVMAILDEA